MTSLILIEYCDAVNHLLKKEIWMKTLNKWH